LRSRRSYGRNPAAARKARGNNKLSSNKQQTITVKQQENKQVIVIEPTDPNAGVRSVL